MGGARAAWVATALTALALVWRMGDAAGGYLRDVTAGVFAVYVPFLAGFVALLLAADDGPWRVLAFLVLTVVSDTGGYGRWRVRQAPTGAAHQPQEVLGGPARRGRLRWPAAPVPCSS